MRHDVGEKKKGEEMRASEEDVCCEAERSQAELGMSAVAVKRAKSGQGGGPLGYSLAGDKGLQGSAGHVGQTHLKKKSAVSPPM